MREENFKKWIATIITWYVNRILVQYHFCVDRGPIIQEKAKNAWDICNVASIAQNDLADSRRPGFFQTCYCRHFVYVIMQVKNIETDAIVFFSFFFKLRQSMRIIYYNYVSFFFHARTNQVCTQQQYLLIVCCLCFVPCAAYVTLKHECVFM